MANNVETLQRTYDNYCRIWLKVTELIASGATQAQIDALTSEAEGAGVVTPKPTYGLDGESYDWTGYQQALEKIMEGVRRQMIFAGGPFEVRSVAH